MRLLLHDYSGHAFLVQLARQLARERLEPGGVFVQWIGIAFVDEAMLRSGFGYAADDVHAYLEAKVAGRRARRPRPVRWRG